MKIDTLSLGALKYFIDAVRLKSVTKSAEKNHVSRPAVSQAILRLEEWYGRPLLEHEKRSFGLTPTGKEFYQIANNAYSNFERELVSKRVNSKSLQIGCSTSLLDWVFPKIEKYLKEAEAPVIKFGTTDQLIDNLRDGSINIALAIDNGKDRTFKFSEFHRGMFHVLSKSGRFEDNLITTDDRPETESFQKFAVKNKVHFKSHIRVEIWALAVRFVQLGAGCCIVPDFIESKGLRMIKAPYWEMTYSVAAFVRNVNELSPLEDKLIKSISR
jgi:DNA-binding transcriptional LysR family regulator